jgi:hypothetical protein
MIRLFKSHCFLSLLTLKLLNAKTNGLIKDKETTKENVLRLFEIKNTTCLTYHTLFKEAERYYASEIVKKFDAALLQLVSEKKLIKNKTWYCLNMNNT